MRKMIRRLVDNSECILSTGYSFLFVSDFEKKKFIQKYEEDCLRVVEGLSAEKIILDEEWAEIRELIDKGEVIHGYDTDMDPNNIGWCKIMNRILSKRKEASTITEKNVRSEEKMIELFRGFDKKPRILLLNYSIT